MIAGRLEERRVEIEEGVWNRITSIDGIDEVTDPEYFEGLQRAVPIAFDHGLAAIRYRQGLIPAIPTALLAQARLAARNGVLLETVLRRYSAGHNLLKLFLIEEIEASGLLGGLDLKDIMRTLSFFSERLMAVVSEEYMRETKRPISAEMRRAELVRGLLRGEVLDTSGLRYEFDVFHIGAIIHGPKAKSMVKGLADILDCIPLVVQNGDRAVWAWFGRRKRPHTDQLEKLASTRWPPTLHLAIGEAAHGMLGWRHTHRQASLAFLFAQHKPGNLIRYAEEPILFSAMRDDVLKTFLRDFYLAPLEGGRDGGDTLRDTLRAYFASDRNGASAAAALKVSRQTVTNRLRVVEGLIGRPLTDCARELEMALNLEEIAA